MHKRGPNTWPYNTSCLYVHQDPGSGQVDGIPRGYKIVVRRQRRDPSTGDGNHHDDVDFGSANDSPEYSAPDHYADDGEPRSPKVAPRTFGDASTDQSRQANSRSSNTNPAACPYSQRARNVVHSRGREPGSFAKAVATVLWTGSTTASQAPKAMK
jgi:hypothetical protein